MLRSPRQASGSTPDLTRSECEDNLLREGDSNITLRKRKHSEEYTEALNKFSDKIMAMFGNWRAEVGRENSLINDNLNILKTDITTLRENSQDLKTELQCMRKEYSEIKNMVHLVNTKNKDLEKEITLLQKSSQFISEQQDDLVKKVESLSHEILPLTQIHSELADLRQQNDRLMNLEFVGVPEKNGENLIDIVHKITKHVGVDISADEIVHVNRVASRSKQNGRPRVIIAKMKTRLVKDNILSRSRKCRLTSHDLGLPGDLKPIYINEHLTVYNKILLKKCKESAKLKLYQYVWSKHGRIFMRKNDTAPPLHIASEEDLRKIT